MTQKHCIWGPFELRNFFHRSGIRACFSPDGDHILTADYNHAAVLDIERGKKLKAQGSQISLFTMVVTMG